MKRKKPKGPEQRAHFKRRLFERYGIEINRIEYSELCERLRRNGADVLYVRAESNTRTHWIIEIQGVKVRAVYDKARGQLVTALPPEADVSRREAFHVESDPR